MRIGFASLPQINAGTYNLSDLSNPHLSNALCRMIISRALLESHLLEQGYEYRLFDCATSVI